MTGTAVNPLFRAAYLAKDGERPVSLVIPWLSLKDQKLVYPNNITFSRPTEQEAYVRRWLDERIGFKSDFSILFYPGKYQLVTSILLQFSLDKRSILAAGDISEVVPDENADVAILEEPEHLTWFHHGKRWKIKFRLVVGIIHTNYLEYVIRLSAATQDYPKSIVCNVHGVNPKFLVIGNKKLEQQRNGVQAFTKGAYYIGKMVWSKGYKELLKLLQDHQKELTGLEVDLYGSGEDSDQVQEAAKRLELAVRVHPGRDHADLQFHDYKVFLNPSTTDVLCTTTAEALAMGKIVVCANHPSNEFFKQFPNCRTYDNADGFVKVTQQALAEEPVQLTDAQRHELSWEAATERFLRVAELDQAFTWKPSESISKRFMSTSLGLWSSVEDASAYVHHVASGFETTRKIFGAIPKSLQPDEEQCKELGLAIPAGKRGSQK
ncbi:hypothetical protein DVH24_014151 [Malus domestica]|uniref:Digalactosyldiacylglycerol synthase 2, chloroplastic n=1 Tax=Malus domestica TaxID=3750 RepID=A0A498JFF5_MALDO|nr:hypothetical protein DVH24_014151 [Malus domestica]